MSQNKNSGRIEWMKRFAFDRPVIFSILVILAAGLLTEIPLDVILVPWAGDPGAEFLKVTIGHTLTGLITYGTVGQTGVIQKRRVHTAQSVESHIAVNESVQTAVANNTITQAVSALIITLPLLLYGLFILRKVRNPKQSE